MTIGEFFKKIGHGFKVAAITVGHGFVHFFGKEASDEFVSAAKKILASDFGKVIESILLGLVEFKAANGDAAARSEAFTQIKTAAIDAGLDIKNSVINLMIELAANKLNGNLDSIALAAK
jgi:hypothetical protein